MHSITYAHHPLKILAFCFFFLLQYVHANDAVMLDAVAAIARFVILSSFVSSASVTQSLWSPNHCRISPSKEF